MGTLGQPRSFGLVAGMGVGASIFYYKALVDAHLALGLAPRLIMVHADLNYVMSQAVARNTKALSKYLAGLLRQLALGGAEIASIPAFAPQVCADELAAITPLPLVSLLDSIAADVERRRWHRVALFGSRVTMETQMFGRLDQTEVIAPTAAEINTIAEIYVRVVQEACVSTYNFERLRLLAHTLIERERLDGIILAGTDLAVVFNPDNADFSHLDGARVHIDAIMGAIVNRSPQGSG
jgi:aspartate racemase